MARDCLKENSACRTSLPLHVFYSLQNVTILLSLSAGLRCHARNLSVGYTSFYRVCKRHGLSHLSAQLKVSTGNSLLHFSVVAVFFSPYKYNLALSKSNHKQPARIIFPAFHWNMSRQLTYSFTDSPFCLTHCEFGTSYLYSFILEEEFSYCFKFVCNHN